GRLSRRLFDRQPDARRPVPLAGLGRPAGAGHGPGARRSRPAEGGGAGAAVDLPAHRPARGGRGGAGGPAPFRGADRRGTARRRRLGHAVDRPLGAALRPHRLLFRPGLHPGPTHEAAVGGHGYSRQRQRGPEPDPRAALRSDRRRLGDGGELRPRAGGDPAHGPPGAAAAGGLGQPAPVWAGDRDHGGGGLAAAGDRRLPGTGSGRLRRRSRLCGRGPAAERGRGARRRRTPAAASAGAECRGMSAAVVIENAAWAAARPAVSVLIPFLRDDPADLLHRLEAEAAGLDGAAEVVLLDDGTADADLTDRLSRQARAMSLPTRLITLPRNEG